MALANFRKNNLITLLLFLVAVVVFSPSFSVAATRNSDGPVNIDADVMDYDSTSDVYHAQGSVVVTYEGGVLTANEVEYDKKNSVATAYGDAVLRMGNDTLAGDKIVFNVEKKTGIAYQGRAFYAQNHFYIKGDEIEKTGEMTYKIIQPVATTCDGDKPDWAIAGSEMKVTVEGYGLMKDARMVAKDVPVFYTPFLPFPAKTKRQSGFLLPYLAYSKNKDGLDIELPYFWAISPQLDATLYQRYMEKRGWKEGVEFRYYAGKNSYGTFYGDYLNDKKYPDDSNAVAAAGAPANSSSRNRWSYYLNHQTNFDSSSYLRTDLRKVSDNWYFRDFSSHNYYRDNYARTEANPFKKIPFLGDESLASLESTARFYKGWSNYSLTALVSYTDNLAATSNDSTLQKYPEITFTGTKQPLFNSPLYFEFVSVYDYYYRNEGQKGHFIDLYPTFSLPFNVSRYAKVIPKLSIRETFWNRDDDGATTGDDKTGVRSIYDFSLAVSSQISRVFDVNVQNWEKIRHEIKPELTYAYTPDVSQDDLPDYAPAIKPTIAPVTPASANTIMEQNAIAWGLTNTFTAKRKDDKGNYSYLEFLRVKLLQTFDINEARRDRGNTSKRYWSDMITEVDFRPHQYLSFAARNKYNVYDGWTVTNYDMTISDKRGDSATLRYRYTRDSIEEIDAYFKAVITDKINATYITRLDRLHSRDIENTFGLNYHKQCWLLGFEVSRTESLGTNSDMEKDTKFVLKFALTGLGKN